LESIRAAIVSIRHGKSAHGEEEFRMTNTKKSITAATIGFALLLAVGAPAAVAQDAEFRALIEEFLSSDDFFMTIVDQEGHIAGVQGDVVEIDRGPFDLVLVFRDPTSAGQISGSVKSVGVLVNFSFRDEICRGFRDDRSLKEILRNPDDFMGMAEHSFNPEEKVVVDDITPHYLYVASRDDHRFSSVARMSGAVVCRRLIAYYSHLESIEEKSPIELIQGDSLFISLLHSEWGQNYERIEKQRECVEIRFRK
jgi:hypothetical protein